MLEAILMFDRTNELNSIQSLNQILNRKFNPTSIEDNSIRYYPLTDKDQYLSLSEDNDMHTYFEKDDLNYVNSILSTPCFYLAEFSDLSLFKEVVIFLNSFTAILIDDDNGHIYDFESFLKQKEW